MTISNVKFQILAKKLQELNSQSDRKLKRIKNYDHYRYWGGFRFVHPYFFDFVNYCKGRWKNRTVEDVFGSEFQYYNDTDFLEKRISDGKIKVNGKPVTKDYVLKHMDEVLHRIHRHELLSLDEDFKFLAVTDDFLVIDKPASLPVHPSGRYRKNTIVYILELEYGMKKLFPIHRLDRLTSGLLVIGRNKHVAQTMGEFMRSGYINKTYLARVKGKFKNNDPITIKSNIILSDARMGRWQCVPLDEKGKFSETYVVPMTYDAKTDTTLVVVRPLTGRTHQIRLHLQYIGNPIINDPTYGPDDRIKEYKERYAHIYQYLSDTESIGPPALKRKKIDNLEPWQDAKEFKDENCIDCNSYTFPKQKEDLIIYLHSYQYDCQEVTWKTEIPEWAKPCSETELSKVIETLPIKDVKEMNSNEQKTK